MNLGQVTSACAAVSTFPRVDFDFSSMDTELIASPLREFFFIFLVFFSLLMSFPGTLLCCPSLWPPLSAPQPCKFLFFYCFPLLKLILVFEGCPSRATRHINLAHPTSSGSVDTPPLHHVNAPGILCGASTPLVPACRCPGLGAFISAYFYFLSIVSLCLLFFSKRCSHLLATALSYHPPMPCPHPSSTPATACTHPNFVSTFFFLFCLRSLPPTSMPLCCIPTPPPVLSGCVDAPASATCQRPWDSLHRCPGLGPIYLTID